MKNLANIRNIGIIAHIDAGKTTTTERILYFTQRIHKMGEVDEGTTVTDWMDEEKARGISITSACVTCFWLNNQINIIDTPGHVDFTGEVARVLKILDGVVVIFSAVEGVEAQSEAVWHQANKYNIPKIVYINKLDRIGADYHSCIKMIKNRLGGKPIILQVPFGIEKDFCGVCDLIKNKLIRWKLGSDGREFFIEDIPYELKEECKNYRDELIETLCMEDNEIANEYFSLQKIEEDKIIKSIRRLTIEKQYSPIFFGSSLKNVGIQPLLDGIVNYLPSPLDMKYPIPMNSKFCGLVFKLEDDKHDRVAYVRIYSGSLKSGSTVLNVNTGKKVRISQMFSIFANKKEIINEAYAGDIVGIYGLKEARTWHTISDIDQKYKIDVENFPEPVLFQKIEPKTAKDSEKFLSTLEKLEIDDPTIRVEVNEETGETLLWGMGELHLDVLKNRIEKEFNLKVKMGPPQVAYKETITKEVIERVEFVKQIGDKRHFACVEIKLAPVERGKGFIFKEKIKDKKIPIEFIESIKKGAENALKIGSLAGFPVIDVEVIVTDAEYHDVDSLPIDFEIAGNTAVKNAIKKAAPILLEPVMELEIIIPQEYVGDVIENLVSRGGKVFSLTGSNLRHTIKGLCPLRKLFGYATDLRTITQGREVHFIEFNSYQRVVEEKEILKKLRGY